MREIIIAWTEEIKTKQFCSEFHSMRIISSIDRGQAGHNVNWAQIERITNRQFAWPSVLTVCTLLDFWSVVYTLALKIIHFFFRFFFASILKYCRTCSLSQQHLIRIFYLCNPSNRFACSKSELCFKFPMLWSIH